MYWQFASSDGPRFVVDGSEATSGAALCARVSPSRVAQQFMRAAFAQARQLPARLSCFFGVFQPNNLLFTDGARP